MRTFLLRSFQILPCWELGSLRLFRGGLLLLLLRSRFDLSSLVLEAGSILLGWVASGEVDDVGMLLVLVVLFVSNLPFERATRSGGGRVASR